MSLANIHPISNSDLQRTSVENNVVPDSQDEYISVKLFDYIWEGVIDRWITKFIKNNFSESLICNKVFFVWGNGINAYVDTMAKLGGWIYDKFEYTSTQFSSALAQTQNIKILKRSCYPTIIVHYDDILKITLEEFDKRYKKAIESGVRIVMIINDMSKRKISRIRIMSQISTHVQQYNNKGVFFYKIEEFKDEFVNYVESLEDPSLIGIKKRIQDNALSIEFDRKRDDAHSVLYNNFKKILCGEKEDSTNGNNAVFLRQYESYDTILMNDLIKWDEINHNENNYTPTHSVIDCSKSSQSEEVKNISSKYEQLLSPLPLAGYKYDPAIIANILELEFPWMSELITSIRRELILRKSAGSPWIRLRPRLLVGPPGTGKTRFARRMGLPTAPLISDQT